MAIEPAPRLDDVEGGQGQRRRCGGFQCGQVTLLDVGGVQRARNGKFSLPFLIIPYQDDAMMGGRLSSSSSSPTHYRDGETMARRFYSRDDLERVKQSLDALHAELQPARKPGRGDRRCYVCPACGRDGKVRVYRGNVDGAAVWSCVHASCRRAGNIVDLYMIRDGLTAGDATTAVCDRWADELGRPATASSGQRSRLQDERRPGAVVLPADEPAAASRLSTSSTVPARSRRTWHGSTISGGVNVNAIVWRRRRGCGTQAGNVLLIICMGADLPTTRCVDSVLAMMLNARWAVACLLADLRL